MSEDEQISGGNKLYNI